MKAIRVMEWEMALASFIIRMADIMKGDGGIIGWRDMANSIIMAGNWLIKAIGLRISLVAQAKSTMTTQANSKDPLIILISIFLRTIGSIIREIYPKTQNRAVAKLSFLTVKYFKVISTVIAFRV